MIERLKATSVPNWRDEAGVILDDGAFQRAMRLVPREEAQALWADFDAQMERLYAIWAGAGASPSEAAPGHKHAEGSVRFEGGSTAVSG